MAIRIPSTAALFDAWSVAQVWTTGGETPNRYVDVTDVYDAKVAALLAHESQMPGVDDLHSLLREWMGGQAKAAGAHAAFQLGREVRAEE